jgi:Na+/H+-dicarboxylate symporter
MTGKEKFALRNRLIAILTTILVVQAPCFILYLELIQSVPAVVANTAFFLLIMHVIILPVVFIKLISRIRHLSDKNERKEIWIASVLIPSVYSVLILFFYVYLLEMDIFIYFE